MAPNQKRFVLKLANSCECDGCLEKLVKLLKIYGVHSTLINAKTREITVSGPVDPQKVISFLEEKGKNAKLVTEEIQPQRNYRPRKAQIEGVDSIDIDKDLELGKATISGNVDPQTVTKKRKDRAKKHPELLGEEARPPKINHQEKQIVRHQNPVRIDQRKEAPQPPGPISKSVHKHCDPKHGDDHELELKSYNKPFKCNKCREDGFASGYRCKHCIYDLHKECWKPKHEITPDLFPGFIFKFSEKPGKNCTKICDACGMEIHGHFYNCKANLNLHPACSKLPGKLPISDTDFVLCKEVKYKCFFCKKKKPSWFAETKVTGLCYVSERDKFCCHVHCLSLVMQEAWKRGRGDLDRNKDNDATLGKMDLKHGATAKVSGGEGGGLFLKMVTIFLKTIFSILFGDPTGFIVFVLPELVKGLLTL